MNSENILFKMNIYKLLKEHFVMFSNHFLQFYEDETKKSNYTLLFQLTGPFKSTYSNLFPTFKFFNYSKLKKICPSLIN